MEANMFTFCAEEVGEKPLFIAVPDTNFREYLDEAERFDLLPLLGKNKRRMEEMILSNALFS